MATEDLLPAKGDIAVAAECFSPPLTTGKRLLKKVTLSALAGQDVDLATLFGHGFEGHPAIVSFRARTVSCFVAFKAAAGSPTVTTATGLEIVPAEGWYHWWIGKESAFLEWAAAAGGVLELFISQPVPGQ